nr:uncharacterized protein LOC113740822 [Coffea arabica]
MADDIAEILQKFVLSNKEMGGIEIDLGNVGPSVKECGESLAKESGKEGCKNNQEGREEQVKKDAERKNLEWNLNIVLEKPMEQILKEPEGKRKFQLANKDMMDVEVAEVLEAMTTAFTMELHIMDLDINLDWWFIGIYANTDDQIRNNQWKVVERRKELWGLRWIILPFSVNINGKPKGCVIPSRGIRQSDPLSPYLFLPVSEGFSNLLAQAERNHRLNGMKISGNGPSLTHLFFADDSLIFYKAEPTQAEEVMRILKMYEKGSGQLINMEKSSGFL